MSRIKVNDTCICGAEFCASGDNGYNQVSNRHDKWLSEHKECRDSYSEGINETLSGHEVNERSEEGVVDPCPHCGEERSHRSWSCQGCGDVFDPTLINAKAGRIDDQGESS